MPKITSVEPQKKNLRLRLGQAPHRFNIFLDGQFAFGADEDLVVEHRLVIGKVLDAGQVEKLLFEAEVGKLMERMYRLWNIRPRSEKEVRDYFRIKNYELRIKNKEPISDMGVEMVIEKLKQKKLLDDKEFAKAWVESRRKSKKKGKIALRAELFQKGIDRDLIEEVLEEKTSQESEEILAKGALEKRVKAWKNLSRLEFKKKAYEFLLRRGFEYSLVRDVVENYLKKGYNT
ncbi:RecX family transcriptional regulator [Candidatus Daviesbacteria bacterium]|nr:RecX family transcriptional regulator [Candidatus Daviesbacteria bacterium]